MPRQLTFDLPVRPALGREAFFVSPANGAALAAIEAWRVWPNGRHLLTGPAGSGKTHLVHVWAALVDAEILAARDLTSYDVPQLVGGPIAMEDVDNGVDEAALFHLMNLAQAEGCPLLMSAGRSPSDWGLVLPDLVSRLGATPVARLDAPDDALLAAVLVKLFDDRQLVVTPDVVDYLLPRMERSLDAAGRIVAAVDEAALAARRPVTRTLVRGVLDNPAPPDA